jgi:hypothetical protein
MSRSRPLRVIVPFVVAIATVAAIAAGAGAHDTDFGDPNDTSGKLDVSQVRLGHEGPAFWTIVTFARWSVNELWDAGYLMVLVDTANNPDPEYYVLIRSDGNALLGSLWRIQPTGPDSYLGTAPVKRQSGRSASVQLRLRRLMFGPHRDYYRWWVITTYTADTCVRTCVDRAPNGTDMRQQWLPGRSPTPSPSPSPSP